MVNLRAALEQHLLHAAQAYGADLVLPRGTATPRAAASAVAPAAHVAPTAPPPGSHAPAPSQPAAQPTVAPPTRLQPTSPVAAALAELQEQVAACTRCKLHEFRNRAVFGEGSPTAAVMFVGEAPGANEDRTGRPFVGEAGQLLTRILNGAMGLRRADVYIANINKCRPPSNRVPTPDEAGACLPYLQRQVELLQPKVIVCLGRTAVHHLLGRPESVAALRGKPLEYLGIPVVATWHPAYLLRDPSHKQETWEDIMRVNRLLGRPERPEPVQETG